MNIDFWPKNPKPNLLRNQVCACFVITKGYETDLDFWLKNPKANFRNGKMNVSTVKTMNYEPQTMNDEPKNKPNQTQSVVSLSNLFRPGSEMPHAKVFSATRHSWFVARNMIIYRRLSRYQSMAFCRP